MYGQKIMNIYILYGRGSRFVLYGANGYNNGVGLLDAVCDYCYGDNNFKGSIIRNMKIEDFNGKIAGVVRQY